MPEFPSVELVDSLRRVESPLSNGGKWTILPIAGVGTIGRCKSEGWVPNSEHGGAYWNPRVWVNPAAWARVAEESFAGRWVALWVCLSKTVENGYRLRAESLSEFDRTEWKLYVEKCVAGAFTVLESKVMKTSTTPWLWLGLTVVSGKLKVWWKLNFAAAWEVAFEVADSTYTEGYVGLEAKGGPNMDETDELHVGAQEEKGGEHEQPLSATQAQAVTRATTPARTLSTTQGQSMRTFVEGEDIFGTAANLLPMVV